MGESISLMGWTLEEEPVMYKMYSTARTEKSYRIIFFKAAIIDYPYNQNNQIYWTKYKLIDWLVFNILGHIMAVSFTISIELM